MQAKALVTAEAFKTSDYLGMVRALAPELETAEPGRLHAAKLPHLRIVIRTGAGTSPGMISFDDLAGLGGSDDVDYLNAVAKASSPYDPINIQFTSGTTGAPKGATLSHVNIVNNGRFTVRRIDFTEADRLCIPVPLYHCFGMVMGTLGCAATGAAMVFPGEGFDPLATLKALSSERCTAVYGVPTMFSANARSPRIRELRLRRVAHRHHGGRALPHRTHEARCGRHGTARGDHRLWHDGDESRLVPESHGRSAGTPRDDVGRVHPHVEVKVVDTDTGQTMAPGGRGELLTRGYSVMLGYWDDEENTRAAIDADGFMHTGDLATIDAAGYGNIVGG